MEENVQTDMTDQKKTERPVFLTVLLILTFIGSGLGLLFGIIGLFTAGSASSFMSSIPGMPTATLTTGMMITSIILSAASLAGAILMWQLKQIGFYLYTLAQIIALIVTFNWFGLVISAIFVVLYAIHLKYMS
jgi:hypothetical protein